jgi:tRNA pseudouridine55 synthase
VTDGVEGLLVIDKPAGPTSHDVVARMRRVLRERRIGHTGTLDPLATGVLPLVVGRATRLARFLSASDKAYEAVIRLGVATDSGDADGTPLGAPCDGQLPTREDIDRALDAFRGQFLQQPPVFSAKKISGQRSHRLARRLPDHQVRVNSQSKQSDLEVRVNTLTPVAVTVSRLEVTALDGDRLSLTVDCSAGFYVRALAHDLGVRLGTGAHLTALRRTRSGDLTLADAISLENAIGDREAAASRIIPLGRMLNGLPAMILDADAVRRTVQGRDVEARIVNPESRHVRLLDAAGDLVAIAEPAASGSGLLHPSVVLR